MKSVTITIGILNGCRILDTTIDWAEPDSPITASSGEVLLQMGALSSINPFSTARAALWPVSGYAHESNIVYPSVWLGNNSVLWFISSTASLIVWAQRKALGSKLRTSRHISQNEILYFNHKPLHYVELTVKIYIIGHYAKVIVAFRLVCTMKSGEYTVYACIK